MTGRAPELVLRDVTEADLPVFFEQQLDADANRMAAFTSRDPADRGAFNAHWARILADASIIKKTILVDGQVAGHVSSFEMFGHREVTYWLGRSFWGRGLATRALSALLEHESWARPRGTPSLAASALLEAHDEEADQDDQRGKERTAHERAQVRARGGFNPGLAHLPAQPRAATRKDGDEAPDSLVRLGHHPRQPDARRERQRGSHRRGHRAHVHERQHDGKGHRRPDAEEEGPPANAVAAEAHGRWGSEAGRGRARTREA